MKPSLVSYARAAGASLVAAATDHADQYRRQYHAEAMPRRARQLNRAGDTPKPPEPCPYRQAIALYVGEIPAVRAIEEHLRQCGDLDPQVIKRARRFCDVLRRPLPYDLAMDRNGEEFRRYVLGRSPFARQRLEAMAAMVGEAVGGGSWNRPPSLVLTSDQVDWLTDFFFM